MINQSNAGVMRRKSDHDNTFLFLTDINSILVSGEDTNGEFCVVHCSVNENDGPPLHVHENEDESFYVLDGELEMIVGADTFLVQSGEYVFAPRGIPHTFKVKSNKARFLITAYPAGFDSFVKELGTPYAEGMEALIEPPTPEFLQRLIQVSKKYNITYPGL
ncbi:quercetin dioxygenase-like cupin family protein [Paenibacillus endophyticus]|uniref:Quercetin dioxygenase-like cupin family protein n=1 Tax=Paenibacillus endophyticus TaxID=1294268 RepID=A0A7W5CDX5_9BACL|nr:quercetin 2,3-dioxygenase [Paenibacillus endophyticus]MBB3155842.1 quercetin dioxygenase-like cupin family protein [Paenibacillus endophyticus]